MKRLFCCFSLLLTATLLFCPSCKSSTATPFSGLSYPFCAKVTIHFEERTMAGTLCLDEQTATLALQEPQSVEGVVFSLSREGQGTLSVGDLTLPVSKDRLPAKGQLFDALWKGEDADFLKSSATVNGEKMTLYTLVESEQNLLFYFKKDGTICRLVGEGTVPFTVLFESQGKG